MLTLCVEHTGCQDFLWVADLPARLFPGYNALHLSAKHGHPQCVSKLLQVRVPGRRLGKC